MRLVFAILFLISFFGATIANAETNLDLLVVPALQMKVTNPDGRNIICGSNFSSAPSSIGRCSDWGPTADLVDTATVVFERSNTYIVMSNISIGNYTVEIAGLSDTASFYRLSFLLGDDVGNFRKFDVCGIVTKQDTTKYTFEFTGSVNATSEPIKLTTINSFIRDIELFVKIGWLEPFHKNRIVTLIPDETLHIKTNRKENLATLKKELNGWIESANKITNSKERKKRLNALESLKESCKYLSISER